ncbi:MAG: class I SAM-dependent DNA methyltransferase, partial [Polyangiales bacterium]
MPPPRKPHSSRENKADPAIEAGTRVEALIARVAGDLDDSARLLAWAKVDAPATLRALTAAIVAVEARTLARARGLEVEGAKLLRFFDRAIDPLLARRLIDHAGGIATPAATLVGTTIDDVEALGRARESLLDLQLVVGDRRVTIEPTAHRRRSGAHYTPAPLALRIVDETLSPWFGSASRSIEKTSTVRVCDPAMGSGVFLLATLRWLVAHAPEISPAAHARATLSGVDLDPLAVEVARWTLAIEARDLSLLEDLDASLIVGDALADATLGTKTFDAIVGNPPWVSFAGRAAQPIEPSERIALKRRFQAFHGYPSLHGVFVERAAELLASHGRLGLLVPSSMSELDKYAPARRALDRRCACDEALDDLGDGPFEGVFQPCMILLATRRESPRDPPSDAAWPIARADLDAIDRAILAKLDRPPLPPALFGERGLQSEGDDAAHWRVVP